MSSAPYLRLAELGSLVYEVMAEVFGERAYWVLADVTSHTYKAGKGHHYFELVEKDPASNTILARFSARAWTEGAGKISSFEQATGQRFTNDINVLVLVTIQYHPAYGLQLNLIDIDTSFTLGTLKKQKQATLLRLLQENPEHIRLEEQGYVTFNQELPLSRVVQRIAVISSSTSAGFEDFQHTLTNNRYNYSFEVDTFFTLMQGENNARQVVEKLIEIYQSEKVYEAVVIIRGGGAQTDFLLFEQYAIGRAIARFPLPVITGIGHQRDETIADLMAHTSTKTPTQAAEMLISRNREFHDELNTLQRGIVIRTQQLLAQQNRVLSQLNSAIISTTKDKLALQQRHLSQRQQLIAGRSQAIVFGHYSALQLTASKVLRKPELLISRHKQEVACMAVRLMLSGAHNLKMRQTELNYLDLQFKLMRPENILQKGFAVVKSKNRILNSAEKLSIGQDIAVILAGKEITAIVTATNDHDNKELNL